MPTTKTKTSPSGLTSEEQKELNRRGFLVKQILNIQDVIEGIFGGFIVGGILLLPLCIIFFSDPDLLMSLIVPLAIGLGIYIGGICGGYIVGKNLFLGDHKSLFAGKYYKSSNTPNITRNSQIGSYLSPKFLSLKNIYGFLSEIQEQNAQYFPQESILGDFIDLLITVVMQLWRYILAVLFLSTYGLLIYLFISSEHEIWNVFIFFLYCIPAAILICLIGSTLYNLFLPLCRLNSIAKKIQSLTPSITEESEKIEKEFSKDMNFRVLSDSFDTLAEDFSKVSQYVIKLETIEQKANKGNLFDSEKYIGSLREDIVKPLTTLRSFLEKKKTELEKSKEELRNLGALDAETSSAGQKVRVRVGGAGNGEIENLELQSKRSEPLINELTENIEKLDIMIEKFGKI